MNFILHFCECEVEYLDNLTQKSFSGYIMPPEKLEETKTIVSKFISRSNNKD